MIGTPAATKSKTTIWSIGKAHYESSIYEGEYRGTMIRVERHTSDDRAYDGGYVVTVWHGYVADGMWDLKPAWSLVVEEEKTRRETIARLERYVDSMISTGTPRF